MQGRRLGKDHGNPPVEQAQAVAFGGNTRKGQVTRFFGQQCFDFYQSIFNNSDNFQYKLK
jgi:hypothetical protein